jgi:hypothetical protein
MRLRESACAINATVVDGAAGAVFIHISSGLEEEEKRLN